MNPLRSSLVVVGLFAAVAAGMTPGPGFQVSDGRDAVIVSGPAGTREAVRDTTYLLGGPGRWDGRFENEFHVPDWQGWTHRDETFVGVSRWNVSTYRAPAGNYAIWCGQTGFAEPCNEGYGNSWNEHLVFTYTVPDPAVATTVRLQALFNSDSEPGFDYLNVQMNRWGTWQDIAGPFCDIHVGETIDVTVTFVPGDYVGAGSNQLQLRFSGTSDSGWSDEDCFYDSHGLAQVDNIRVTITDGPVFYEDFEAGVSDDWVEFEEPGFGDYSKLWTNLQDIDPCVTNPTTQVAFIDDGVVVPGTGGTPCITWCYGPGGYVVNYTGNNWWGGQAIDNLVVSPVLTMPPGSNGARLDYTVYAHEDLTVHSPSIFYQWHVRSVSSGDPADLANAAWEDRNFIYYGRGYFRRHEPLTDLLVPGCTHLQVALRCKEFSSTDWETEVDGTPAPYFDNVAVVAYPQPGPYITAREIDLAQSSFPQRGVIDLGNLANNWIRFDMARNISPSVIARNDPGDSILADIALTRAGSVLHGMPKLRFKIKYSGTPGSYPFAPAMRTGLTNPRLHEVDTSTPPYITGWVHGDSTRQANGTLVANRYNFDLPDTGFFFPGDVLHYYIEAQDNVGGDIGTATLPGDLGGFDDFTSLLSYGGNSSFVVRGLPTLFDATGRQPEILFWNDFGSLGGEDEWYYALGNLGLQPGRDFDVYHTLGPSSGVGNGLGGRATSATIAGYGILLYTAGDLGTYTISNGDYCRDPSNDQGVLNAWFAQGGKKAFFTGDDLVYNLRRTGASGLAFVANHFNVTEVSGNLMPLINNQTTPRVRTIPGNSIFTSIDEWQAYGGCPTINDFDAIEPLAGTERLGEFLTPAGEPGYTYAAAIRRVNIGDVILMPYDFMFIANAPGYVPPVPGRPARTQILRDVFSAFGGPLINDPIGVPDVGQLSVAVSPNPFNPRTTIALNLPIGGPVSVKMYDIRGRLIRTLHEGELTAGRHDLVWEGVDAWGQVVASGVYFYEVKAGGQERIGKLTVVR